ncbi:MAG: VOC family protein [Deinococcales bacterium]
MVVMPIIYVTDVQASIRFYSALGFTERRRSRSDNWVELTGEGGMLALHRGSGASRPAAGRVELSLVTTETLERIRNALVDAGMASVGPIMDEAFGRSLVVTDPDGLEIQVNEHDHELYT